MTDYPDIRAEGASIEVELEQGVTLIAYVGDAGVAGEISQLWRMRHNLAAAAAHVLRQLSQVDRRHHLDADLRQVLADLRRQIDTLETIHGFQCG